MTLSRKQKAFLEIATACLESLHLIYMPYFTLHNPCTMGYNPKKVSPYFMVNKINVNDYQNREKVVKTPPNDFLGTFL